MPIRNRQVGSRWGAGSAATTSTGSPEATKMEQHLKQRFGELFQAEFDVLL
jgi:hypothetical protein